MNREVITAALSKQDLVKQLKHLGLNASDTVEVHCSLKSIGYIIGGAGVLLDALEEVFSEGTIVMSSQSPENTEPLNWSDPPVQLALADKVRENTPGYDIYHSDIHTMGALALELRSRRDAYHSYHPNCAFMAWGVQAKELMKSQPLNFPFSYGSPLDKLYHLDNAKILLIGVDYKSCTGLHFGECISEVRNIILAGGAVKKDGETVWKKYLDYDLDTVEFNEIGRLMERNRKVRTGKLGEATCRLMDYRMAVESARDYFVSRYRKG